MKRSKKGIVRLLLDAWRGRGWVNGGDAALVVAVRVEELGRYEDAVADVLPQVFLDQNGIDRDVARAEIKRALSGIEFDTGASEEPPRLKIVFFAASPRDQDQLALDEEAREIEERLRKTAHRDVIDFATKWAVRPGDLVEALNRERPQIVHFSGHGSDTDELVFQDDFGNTKIVSKEAIATTISTVSDEVRLAVFNNCFSDSHAQEAARHIEAAIGMNDSISDDAARVFAANFYAALGYGRTVQVAFDQARASLMLEGIAEERTPQLFVKAGTDPSTMTLVAG